MIIHGRGPRFVYGDSYGDVGNRELSMDAARDSRLFNSLSSNRAAQALAMQAAQTQAGNNLSWQQLLQQAAENAARTGMARDRFDFDVDSTVAQLGMNRERMASDDAYRTAGLGLQRRELELRGQPDNPADADYEEVVQAIGSGYFDRPGVDIATLFPSLGQNRLARANAFVTSRQAARKEQDSGAENQAKLLNDQLLQLRRTGGINKLLSDATTKKNEWNLTLDSTVDKDANRDRLKLLAGESDAALPPIAPNDLQKFLGSVAKNPRIGSTVAFDENTQTFAPIRRAGVNPGSGGEAQFKSEAEARAAGRRTGEVIMLLDPALGIYRRARLD